MTIFPKFHMRENVFQRPDNRNKAKKIIYPIPYNRKRGYYHFRLDLWAIFCHIFGWFFYPIEWPPRSSPRTSRWSTSRTSPWTTSTWTTTATTSATTATSWRRSTRYCTVITELGLGSVNLGLRESGCKTIPVGRKTQIFTLIHANLESQIPSLVITRGIPTEQNEGMIFCPYFMPEFQRVSHETYDLLEGNIIHDCYQTVSIKPFST